MIKQFFTLSVLILLLGALPACDKLNELPISNTGTFTSNPTEKPVKPFIEETSGIADSKANAGNLWVQEDSGRPTQLFLVGHNGTVVKKVHLKNVRNRDWEDMTLAGSDLFIGDIGDNNQKYSDYTFYQFAEPSLATDTVKNIKIIQFQYPDGSHDAEAFLVDPQTKDIFIITKQDQPGRIYKLTFPYNYSAVNVVSLVGNTQYTGIVSAAISADGQDIILKSYTSLYHYTRKNQETTAEILQKEFVNIPYIMEPQGEALAFAADNSGFFTLSEKGLAQLTNLYFYKRE